MPPTCFCLPPYCQVSSTPSHHTIIESFLLEGALKAAWSSALMTNRDVCSWIRFLTAWFGMSPGYSWIFILLALPTSHPLQVLFIFHLLLSKSSQVPNALILKLPQHFSLSLSYLLHTITFSHAFISHIFILPEMQWLFSLSMHPESLFSSPEKRGEQK